MDRRRRAGIQPFLLDCPVDDVNCALNSDDQIDMSLDLLALASKIQRLDQGASSIDQMFSRIYKACDMTHLHC